MAWTKTAQLIELQSYKGVPVDYRSVWIELIVTETEN